MTAYTSALRSQPKAETALKIAEQFAVPLTSLYADPEDCLREALEHFSEGANSRCSEGAAVRLVRWRGRPSWRSRQAGREARQDD